MAAPLRTLLHCSAGGVDPRPLGDDKGPGFPRGLPSHHPGERVLLPYCHVWVGVQLPRGLHRLHGTGTHFWSSLTPPLRACRGVSVVLGGWYLGSPLGL